VGGGAADDASCGPAIGSLDVAPGGVAEATIVAPEVLALPDRTVDCRAGSCTVVLRSPAGAIASTPLRLIP
jgi:hypothetical protein